MQFLKVPKPVEPYSDSIPQDLIVGTKIFVRVKCDNNANEFKVNLITPDGIAMHFNPRLSYDIVVMNSRFGDEWGGNEERIENMPFKENESYGIEFNVYDDKFSILVEGNHLCDFQHRVPFQEINYIEVNGDIEIESIIYANYEVPEFNDNGFDNNFVRPNNLIRVPSPKEPYQGEIPNGLVNGKKIFIMFKVDRHWKEFKVNLLTSDGIAMHFNPRSSQDILVMNSRFGDEWGSNEERIENMPFKEKHTYGLEINVEDEKFRINVDGDHLCDFQHRVPYENVKFIEVVGDIEIEDIVFSM